MNGRSSRIQVVREQLNDGRMLIVTDISAYIYEYNEGRIVDELRHTLETKGRPTITKLDDLLTFTSERQFHIIQTEKDNSGIQKFKEIKTIFFNDLIPNLSEKFNKPAYNFFKLQNGNYLLVTQVYLEEFVRAHLINPPHHQLSVEISKDNLEVVRSNTRDITGQMTNVFVNYACLVSDLLVFVGPQEKTDKQLGTVLEPMACTHSSTWQPLTSRSCTSVKEPSSQILSPQLALSPLIR